MSTPGCLNSGYESSEALMGRMEIIVAHIEIYTRPGCGYCDHARQLLQTRELAYVEYDVFANPHQFAELQSRAVVRSFPQIFIDGEVIGGFEELRELDRRGHLSPDTAESLIYPPTIRRLPCPR